MLPESDRPMDLEDVEEESERRVVAALRAARPRPPEGLARRLSLALVLARVRGEALPRLGRYVVEAKLGEGGMGAVFLGRDPDLARRVAIKLWTRGGDRAAVEREARALARLNHPNVLTVHDVGGDGDALWIVTEWVRGDTLRGWRRARPDATLRQLVRLLAEAARGLAAAHEAGLVHCDIKPENILVGDDGRPRVSDFGLARATEDNGASPLGGTPSYVAPELLEGHPPTAASDQYAFSLTLAEMLPPRTTWPKDLLELVERGAHRSPSARWPSMGSVCRMLEDLSEGRGPRPRRTATRSSGFAPNMRELLELATLTRDREEFRSEVLRWLDRHVGFDTALLGRPEVLGPGGPRIVGFEPEFVARFAQDPTRFAPTMGKLVASSLSRAATVRDTDVYSITERGVLPFYTELIGPKGSKVMAIGGLTAAGAPHGSLQLSRASRGAVFRDRELHTIDLLLPIVALAEAVHAAAPLDAEPSESSLATAHRRQTRRP